MTSPCRPCILYAFLLDNHEFVTDGPYVEAKEIVVSFGIIQAADYDAAVAIARECPPGHTIEIRELAGYA